MYIWNSINKIILPQGQDQHILKIPSMDMCQNLLKIFVQYNISDFLLESMFII